MNKYETRIIKIVVAPEGQPIFGEQATTIEIDDEAAGEYVRIRQPTRDENGTVCFCADEWPIVRSAIDDMISKCRKGKDWDHFPCWTPDGGYTAPGRITSGTTTAKIAANNAPHICQDCECVRARWAATSPLLSSESLSIRSSLVQITINCPSRLPIDCANFLLSDAFSFWASARLLISCSFVMSNERISGKGEVVSLSG